VGENALRLWPGHFILMAEPEEGREIGLREQLVVPVVKSRNLSFGATRIDACVLSAESLGAKLGEPDGSWVNAFRLQFKLGSAQRF
jgi:hypothetical protein